MRRPTRYGLFAQLMERRSVPIGGISRVLSFRATCFALVAALVSGHGAVALAQPRLPTTTPAPAKPGPAPKPGAPKKAGPKKPGPPPKAGPAKTGPDQPGTGKPVAPARARPAAARTKPNNESAVHWSEDRLEYEGEIEFEHGQAVLKRDRTTQRVLISLERFLKQNPNLEITIEAHTDSRGKAGYNRELSKKRAWAVRTWLMRRGIAKSRLGAEGKGEDDPQVPEPTECENNKPRQAKPCEEAWAANRRFRFPITGGLATLTPEIPAAGATPPAAATDPAPAASEAEAEAATPPPPKPKAPLGRAKPPQSKPKAQPNPKKAQPKPKAQPNPKKAQPKLKAQPNPKKAQPKPKAHKSAHRKPSPHPAAARSASDHPAPITPRTIEKGPRCPALVGFRLAAGGPSTWLGTGLNLQPGLCWMEMGVGAGGGWIPIHAASNGSRGSGQALTLSMPARVRIWWMRRHSLLLDLGAAWTQFLVTANATDGDGQPFTYRRTGGALLANAALGYGYRPHGGKRGWRLGVVFGASKYLTEIPASTTQSRGSADQYDRDAIRVRLDRRLAPWTGIFPYAELSLTWMF